MSSSKDDKACSRTLNHGFKKFFSRKLGKIELLTVPILLNNETAYQKAAPFSSEQSLAAMSAMFKRKEVSPR